VCRNAYCIKISKTEAEKILKEKKMKSGLKVNKKISLAGADCMVQTSSSIDIYFTKC